MKKLLLGSAAFLLLAVFAASCGGGGMTPEEIEAEAQKQFDEKKTELQVKADEACEANTPQYVQTAKDSIMQANAAANEGAIQ